MDTIASHIDVTAGMTGGKPHIAGRRITVQNVVVWHERLGLTADEIATEYDLSLGDVYAALAYYHDHRPDIERTMEEDEEFIAGLRERTPSTLRSKLGG